MVLDEWCGHQAEADVNINDGSYMFQVQMAPPIHAHVASVLPLPTVVWCGSASSKSSGLQVTVVHLHTVVFPPSCKLVNKPHEP